MQSWNVITSVVTCSGRSGLCRLSALRPIPSFLVLLSYSSFFLVVISWFPTPSLPLSGQHLMRMGRVSYFVPGTADGFYWTACPETVVSRRLAFRDTRVSRELISSLSTVKYSTTPRNGRLKLRSTHTRESYKRTALISDLPNVVDQGHHVS